MGAALTLLVVLTVSVVVVRTAAVALRLTGMSADVARFQARSAFTGAGFTTSESEAVVNHPLRRRLIGMLMLLGNVGLATVLTTFVVSFLATENSMTAFSTQLFWLLGAIGLLWFIALNPLADRIMCRSIGWLLQRTTSLGQQRQSKLLQVNSEYSVAEHTVVSGSESDYGTLPALHAGKHRVLILGVRHVDGSYVSIPAHDTPLLPGDSVVLYASDEAHNAVQINV